MPIIEYFLVFFGNQHLNQRRLTADCSTFPWSLDIPIEDGLGPLLFQ
jgi:hypothetical protein